jgi:hypothetical protein
MGGIIAAVKVSDLGLVASALAILISAMCAAAVTVWRTGRLVNSDSERLDKQLVHDREQADRQLAHDRAQGERQELRLVIDETLRAVQESIELSLGLLGEFNRVVNFNPPREDEYQEQYAALSDCIRNINGLHSRLSVRLAAGASLPAAVEKCREAASMVRVATMYSWPEVDSHSRDQLSDKVTRVRDAAKDFEDQARLLAQSELRVDAGS